MNLPTLETCQRINELCKELGIDPFGKSENVCVESRIAKTLSTISKKQLSTSEYCKGVFKVISPAPNCEEFGEWLHNKGFYLEPFRQFDKYDKAIGFGWEVKDFIKNIHIEWLHGDSNETQARAEAAILILEGMK